MRLMPASVPQIHFAAGPPSVTITFGRTARICSMRNGPQAATSSGIGVRSSGVLLLRMLAM